MTGWDRKWLSATSRVVLTAFALALWPQEVVASVAQDVTKLLPKPPQPPPRFGSRKLPSVTPPAPGALPEVPSDADFLRFRPFEEPLVPGGATTPSENAELRKAFEQMKELPPGLDAMERSAPLVGFTAEHPDSSWNVALLANLAILARRTGHFSQVLNLGAEAWASGRDSDSPSTRALAARGLVEQAELLARLGRLDELKALLADLPQEGFGGVAAAKLDQVKESVWLMENRPEDSYRCGPLAVGSILSELQGRSDSAVETTPSTDRGTSLLQMRDLSNAIGIPMTMARREVARGLIPTPALVHWRVGHFAALVRRVGTRYLLKDPTFGDETWVSQAAVDSESDGLFLVRTGSVPKEGWRLVSDSEGSSIWGKGAPPSQDDDAGNKKDAPAKPGDPPCKAGMCSYALGLMTGRLRLSDMPLSYSAPKGPPVSFELTYNQREPHQPSVFTYSNVGPNWTMNLTGYVQDDPSDPSQTVKIYEQGGGIETYSGYNGGTQEYAVHYSSRNVLKRFTSPSLRYERTLPDATVEIYGQPDGGITAGRRVFLTETRDAAGNSRRYVYDAVMRIIAVVDALGQVSTLSYESADPWKVTRITDPFGRYSTLGYDSSGRLSSITDVIGLQSAFTYGDSNFVRELSTPYGSTKFETSQTGGVSWIQATDPLGGKHRVEYAAGHDSSKHPTYDPLGPPTGFSGVNVSLDAGMSFYWSKRAMADAPLDYTKAEVVHWMRLPGTNQATTVVRARKMPNENRLWYLFAGQSGAKLGTDAHPIKVGRILDGGASQISEYAYNKRGRMISAKDPLGRETRYTYGTQTTPDGDAANGFGMDLLKVEQKNGASWETLMSSTYDASHNLLTSTDAAGQTTTYTYNAAGQVLTVTTPQRAGITENRTTTMTYDSGTGYLLEVEGVDPSDTASYSYDAQGRLESTTDSDGYTLTFEYDGMDRPTKTTYPDSTTEETVYEKLHVSRTKDRRGRWTTLFTDALRRTTSVRDALGRVVTFDWCACGSLNALIDGKGQRTRWEYDIQGRTAKMIRPDGSFSTYTYEATTSRLKEAVDPRGQKATITYFNDNRWNSVAYSNLASGVASTPSVSFTYDSVYPRLTSMVDGTGTTSYTYHAITGSPSVGAGRLATVDGPLSSDVISYSYDELGRVVQRQINGSASTMATAYDVLGRVSDETNALGAFDYGYDGVTGRLLTMDYPNGNQSTFAYFGNSDDHRLQTIHHKKSGGATISKYDYTYDKEGVIQTWQIQRDAAAAQVFDLGHDLADQLVEATLKTTDPTPAIVKSYRYAYDKAENRTSEEIDEAVVQASHNVLNQLTTTTAGGALQFEGTTNEAASVTVGVVGQAAVPAQTTAANEFKAQVVVPSGTTSVEVKATDPSGNLRTNTYSVSQSGATTNFTYDGNGNMLSDGTRTYEWDAINELVAINQGVNRSEFTYDGWGKRVRMVEKVSGSTVSDRRFLWCGMEICEERDASGASVVKRFFSQGVQDNGTALYYATDHLGSVRELTDTSGAIRARYDYDPYGRTTKISGDKDSDYRYAGLFAHPASGLQLAVFRAYDSNLGRWISEDPIGLEGGLNLFAYVRGAVVGMVDPLGEVAIGTRVRAFALMVLSYLSGDYAPTPDGATGQTDGAGQGLPEPPPTEPEPLPKNPSKQPRPRTTTRPSPPGRPAPKPTRPPRGSAGKGAGRAYGVLGPACLVLDCEGDVIDVLICTVDPCSPECHISKQRQAHKKAEAEKILCQLMPTSCKA